MQGEIVCSFAALDVLGEALGTDVRRFPFSIPHLGATREDRLRLVEAVHQDLVARTLVRNGRFVPELVEALHVFTRGHLTIALVGTAGESQPTALAVTDGRTGVVAEQQVETVVFRPCGPDAIVPGLLRLLPPMRPGPGASVTVTDTSTPARRRVEEDFSEMTFRTRVKATGSSPAGQRAAAEEVLRRPRLGAGYFLVSARGRNGRDTQLGTVNYLDTDAGRYAVIPTTAPDGQLAATYTPADQAALERHLNRIVDRHR
ncbi:ESX secretion-associated protein EspG [Saccharothrix variisporea]|uniref:ESAT-6 protein secretion system EspG family protein n=1 Tax=Saccharothrix variisporea TaxID=543527 RepID=A0A495XH26_9PSEU|nr:ESX secretion-associated protein EspG [Saccharothrix variisporea]RKT73781.1 ESAT-6 protein secretion system EspG family protein [Saccharothrix variisporea]